MMDAELPMIHPEPLATQWEQGAVHIIDVRRPVDFAKYHIDRSVNIPLDELTAAQLPDDGAPIFLVCWRGNWSEVAAQRLRRSEPNRVVTVLAGGLRAWFEAELPFVYPQEESRLNKRLMLILGATTALSVVLTIFVHRGFLGLTGYVMAYLVCVGIIEFGFLDGLSSRRSS